MKIVDLKDFCYVNSDFCGLEVFPESWTKRHSFSQYKNLERPCSALLLICTDISVAFYPQAKPPIIAGKGDLIWIPKGSLYYVEVNGGSNNRIDTYTLNFHLLDENREEILLDDRISVISHDQGRIFESYVEAMSAEVRKSAMGHGIKKTNYLRIKSSFFALLDSASSEQIADNDAYYPIKLGVEALKNEWNKNRRIDEYAQMCGVSATYFYKCFKKWSGRTPTEYRNLLRLSNAEAMLRYTDMKVSEISDTVGFEDPFYFCRVFTRYFGISPKNYKKL